MSVDATSGNWTARGAGIAPARALRLEKPRKSKDCGTGERPDRDGAERRGARPSRRGVYRFGTEAGVPAWDGPQLSSTFAAQVIAQALPGPHDPPAPACYRRAALPPAIFLDFSA